MWARALGLGGETDSGIGAISKIWRRLDETRHLLRRDRRGRLAKITSLREDGLGKAYAYPTGNTRDERYLKLPYEYWTADEHWYRSLPLRAKAMLLVALSLPPGFVLPTNRAPEWYGISSDSADRGLRDLANAGLLQRRLTVKKAPQSPLGFTQEYHHTLLPPFTRPRRLATVTDLRGVS